METTIQDLAKQVANATSQNPVALDLVDSKGRYTWTAGLSGFESNVRLIAQLLKSHGFAAKALRSDPMVNAFKKANREAVLESIRANRAEREAYKAAHPDDFAECVA
jgi:hypothetical protein